jgi:hypothetical protein
VIRSQVDPIATPPAKDAFKRISISSFPNKNLAVIAPPKQLEPIARTVLTIILCCYTPEAKAPLNDGQYIHRKMLPMTAIISLWYEDIRFLECFALPGWKKYDAPIPK